MPADQNNMTEENAKKIANIVMIGNVAGLSFLQARAHIDDGPPDYGLNIIHEGRTKDRFGLSFMSPHSGGAEDAAMLFGVPKTHIKNKNKQGEDKIVPLDLDGAALDRAAEKAVRLLADRMRHAGKEQCLEMLEELNTKSMGMVSAYAERDPREGHITGVCMAPTRNAEDMLTVGGRHPERKTQMLRSLEQLGDYLGVSPSPAMSPQRPLSEYAVTIPVDAQWDQRMRGAMQEILVHAYELEPDLVERGLGDFGSPGEGAGAGKAWEVRVAGTGRAGRRSPHQ